MTSSYMRVHGCYWLEHSDEYELELMGADGSFMTLATEDPIPEGTLMRVSLIEVAHDENHD